VNIGSKPAKLRKRRGAGRPSAEEASDRIENLLDVAAELFLENGYEGASVGEIATRANASKQTLYSRYSTKKDLFTAVMRRRAEAGFEILTDILHSDKPIEEALRTYAEILIFSLIDKETLRFLRTIIGNAETIPEPAEAFWTTGPIRVHQMVTEMIQTRMEKGELRRADPVEAMHIFIALCTGRYWSPGLLGVGRKPVKAEIQEYIETIIRAFLVIYGPQTSKSKLR